MAPAPRLLRHVLVVRADSSAVAEGAEVLARIEAEGRGRAERPRAPIAVARAVRLRGVLEHHQAVPARDARERIHVAHLPVQVHGQDRAGPVGDRGLGGRRVDQAGAGVDVAEDRHRARVGQSECGRYERMRGDDHLVAGLDPGRERADGERGSARRDPHAVARAAVGGELLLEARDLLAEDERAGAQDALESGMQLSRDRLVLTSEVYEWDLVGHGVPRAPAWHANPSIWMAPFMSTGRE